jgi:hypothetical protein
VKRQAKLQRVEKERGTVMNRTMLWCVLLACGTGIGCSGAIPEDDDATDDIAAVSQPIEAVVGQGNSSGYAELSKRYNVVNGTSTWDGTYRAAWHGQTLSVTSLFARIGAAAVGDPVYAEVSSDFSAGASVTYITPGACGGTFAFELTVNQMLVNSDFSVGIRDYAKKTQLYFTNDPSQVFPPEAPTPITPLSSAVFYGKLIKINTGSGYGVADLSWVPPTPYCNSYCQLCKAHPDDPTCP